MRVFALAVVLAASAGLCSCSRDRPGPSNPPGSPAATASPRVGQGPQVITVTTGSAEARELFERGRDAEENFRPVAAAQLCCKALDKDPSFALARAYCFRHATGPETISQLELAAKDAQGLPEPERLAILDLIAERSGNEGRERQLALRLAEVAPDDWRAWFRLATLHRREHRWAEAIAAFDKATKLAPSAAVIYNGLGYTLAESGRLDEAIEALRKATTLAPDEPNPYDSLGDALLQAGRFAEAETTYRRALVADPSFSGGWIGTAYARFYRGAWKGGLEALALARQVSQQTTDQLWILRARALALYLNGSVHEAYQTLDALETQARAQRVWPEVAAVPIYRGELLLDQDRPLPARELARTTLRLADTLDLQGGARVQLLRDARFLEVRAAIRLGDVNEARQALRQLDQLAMRAPEKPQVQSRRSHARGLLLQLRGDLPGAIAAYTSCMEDDGLCRWQLVDAWRRAGNDASARVEQSRIATTYRRQLETLQAWVNATGRQARP